MADPTPYVFGYSFSGFQATAPSSPLPAPPLDNEFVNLEISIASLMSAVKDVRRSDGALAAGIVTLESLSAGMIAGLANLDTDAAAAFDLAVAAVQAGVDADIAALTASKADVIHTHAATDISVSAITGIVGTTVQAVLAELRALGPQTGDFLLTMSNAARTGWVRCDDGTIGNAGSGATTRANVDTLALYTTLWNNVSNSFAPVSGGRSATALIDFNLLRPIALTKVLGRALAIAGAGATLTSRALGEKLGAETVTLALTNLPAANLSSSNLVASTVISPNTNVLRYPGGFADVTPTGAKAAFDTNPSADDLTATTDITGTVPLGGSGTPANIMQPSAFLNAFLKL